MKLLRNIISGTLLTKASPVPNPIFFFKPSFFFQTSHTSLLLPLPPSLLLYNQNLHFVSHYNQNLQNLCFPSLLFLCILTGYPDKFTPFRKISCTMSTSDSNFQKKKKKEVRFPPKRGQVKAKMFETLYKTVVSAFPKAEESHKRGGGEGSGDGKSSASATSTPSGYSTDANDGNS